MRTFKFTLAAFLLIAFCSQAFTQVKTTSSKKLKPPQLTVELLGSYYLPMQETKGTLAEFFSFTNYGTKKGLGGEINIKLAVDRKRGSIRPYLTLGYAEFDNTDNNVAFIDSNVINYGYPRKSGQPFNTVKGSSKFALRNARAGLGIEYAFTQADKKGRFIPFIGLDLFDLNIIWGTYKQLPDSVVGNSAPKQEITYTMNSATRFGFGVGLGFQYRLANAFGLHLGAKYKMANVIGKESVASKTKDEDVNQQNKFNLLDKAGVTLSNLLSKDRNISYIELSFGFSFYVGKK